MPKPFAPWGYKSPGPAVVVLWNQIRKARQVHQLKCGCVILPGQSYHSTGVKLDGVYTYTKQHVWGCLEAGQDRRH